MQEWLNDLSKPSWWGTVVVAGILVNLVAAYVKTPLDTVWSRLSKRRRAASAVRRGVFEDAVARVVADSEERAHLRAQRLEARFQEAVWLFWAILLLGGSKVVGALTILAPFCIIAAFVSMRNADRLGDLLNAAHKRHTDELARRRTTGCS